MREKNTKLSLSCAAFLFLCMLACVVGVASAKTIYVPDDHARIQWAVDNASAGDSIIVRDGVYVGNKKLIITSKNGTENCIVRAANPNDSVFYITADIAYTIDAQDDNNHPLVKSTGDYNVITPKLEIELGKLYAVDPLNGISRLISIDVSTGKVETVAYLSGGGFRSTALAFSPDGELIGVDNEKGQLYKIDLKNFQIVHIGYQNSVLQNVPGIAFDSLGNLYGIDTYNDKLVRIDPSTGVTIVIGDLGVDIKHTGLAIDFQTDELYAVMGEQDGIPDKLLKINKTTGKATIIGLLNVDLPGVGVEFDPVTSELYAVRDFNKLYKINVSTGEATLVNTINASTVSLAAPWPKMFR